MSLYNTGLSTGSRPGVISGGIGDELRAIASREARIQNEIKPGMAMVVTLHKPLPGGPAPEPRTSLFNSRELANVEFGRLADQQSKFLYVALFDPTPHQNSGWPGPDEEFGDGVLTIPVLVRRRGVTASIAGWLVAGAAGLVGLVVATRRKR